MNSDIFHFKYTFSYNYKKLVNKEINQRIVCEIMNQSVSIFPEKYKPVIHQSNNESDFISDSGKCFDAKLLLSQKQCFSLSARCGDDMDFFKSLLINVRKVEALIECNDIDGIRKTPFYSDMKKRIKSSNDNENIILFFPYTITSEYKNSYTTILNFDIFSYLWWILIEEDPSILKNEVFMIYPCHDCTILLRNMNTNQREFIDDKFLHDYFYAVDDRLSVKIYQKIRKLLRLKD